MIAAPPLILIAALVPLILEAALRALLAALAVWAGLRLLSVGNVLVQKAAWGLILIAALAMPLAPHWQALPAFAALRIPAFPQFAPSQPTLIPDKVHTEALIGAHPALTPVRPHEAFSISAPTSNFNTLDLSAPVVNAVPDQAPSQAETDAAPVSSELRSGPMSVKTRPHQNHVKQALASVPATSHPQSNPLPITTLQPRAPKSSPTPISAFAVCWLLYLGVFGALLVRLLVGLASALRLWSKAIPAEFPGFKPSLGLRLRSSSRVASPVNIGSGIVLPADYAEWDEEKLRVVLAHERSHVRQGDFYLQLLAGFYAALFWFSPLGWWLKRKLSELSEAISDRAGLEVAASRSSYAQLLLEFAALPRPTLTGVAMARTSHLAQRIERLLNESSFRQAFAAGGRRALLAVFLVPVALFAATAMIRVEAAAVPTPQAQAAPAVQTSPQATPVGQSSPEQVAEPAPAPAPAPAPEEVPVPPLPPSSDAMPAPPKPPADDAGNGLAPMPPQPPNPTIGTVPPLPPMPDIHVHINPEDIRVHIDPQIRAEIAEAQEIGRQFRGYSYDGAPYAIVGDPGSKPRFIGRWDGTGEQEIEKARKIANGHFLWFRRDDKAYIVDDAAIVSQIEAMNKPMDDLQTQMHGLGDQMRALGEQQRELGKKMRDVSVPTPDLTKEMAELNAAVDSLKAKQGGTISQRDLGDLQREIGRIQGELGGLQGKIGAQQGALGGDMGKFGGQMGELGGQMGKLGAQMGQIARENRSKVDKIIDESLKDGKAKPVQ
jgi:beta-lactamase regulating signal transducer with metallopeptidase domain